MEGRKIEDLKSEREKGVLGEDLGEKKIIVGKGGNPLFIGTASELKTFFTPIFWIILDNWRNYRLGLPYQITDPDMLDIIRLFQEHWEQHFSPHFVTIEYLTAIIKRLDSRRF